MKRSLKQCSRKASTKPTMLLLTTISNWLLTEVCQKAPGEFAEIAETPAQTKSLTKFYLM